jgi:anion-transporting  ArsA/GET3 family ATPase
MSQSKQQVNMSQNFLNQKLLFVLGKGGVGRTSVSLALAKHFVSMKEKVLIVQWSLRDSVSPIYEKSPVSHQEGIVQTDLSTMNYAPDEAIREYFVQHLGMKLLYNLVIENKHVQRLIHASPGVQELFFLGRLFWLVKLAKEERGWTYDRIIVDAPATGHGISLFSIAPTIASFGITGPLAYECERVAAMLADPALVGTVVVTLPEELPVEEALEFVPKLTHEMKRPPLLVCVNKALPATAKASFAQFQESTWFTQLSQNLVSPESKKELQIVARDVGKRGEFEDLLRQRLQTTEGALQVISIPDVLLIEPEARSAEIIERMSLNLTMDLELLRNATI